MDTMLIGTLLRIHGLELIRNLYTNEHMVYNVLNNQMTPLTVYLSQYYINNMYTLLNLCPQHINCNNYYCRYNHIKYYNSHPVVQPSIFQSEIMATQPIPEYLSHKENNNSNEQESRIPETVVETAEPEDDNTKNNDWTFFQ